MYFFCLKKLLEERKLQNDSKKLSEFLSGIPIPSLNSGAKENL